MEYIVLIDRGNYEMTHIVYGKRNAVEMAEIAMRDGALYCAVIDKNGKRVAEYGGAE